MGVGFIDLGEFLEGVFEIREGEEGERYRARKQITYCQQHHPGEPSRDAHFVPDGVVDDL